MYARCSDADCHNKSRYLIDIKNPDGQIETHCRCDSHSDRIESESDIHRIVIPLSEGGSGTTFHAGCSYCVDETADEIIRFEDSFGVVSTEARCTQCVEDIAEDRDLMTRKDILEISIRAEDCQNR